MEDEGYMRRCIELAGRGEGRVAPNPMVGSVLVHEGRVIGEGYHEQYGGPHAEVNCLASVVESDLPLVKNSTLYVSLEPCAHFGKTPPCADLIIDKKIPKVVVGCRDPFPEVNGKGIEKLQRAGIDVKLGVLQQECEQLNKRFFHFHRLHRPYVILKWARTADGFMASSKSQRLLISNEATNRLVHRWRSQEMAILTGSGTVLSDNPSLTTRLWPGKNPIRLLIDREERVNSAHVFFDANAPVIIFTRFRNSIEPGMKAKNFSPGEVQWYQIANDASVIDQVIHALYQMEIQSVLVEGGPKLLSHFIEENAWDEIREIINPSLQIGEGLAAPSVADNKSFQTTDETGDQINWYQNQNTHS